MEMIERNDLILCNASLKCSGVITRRRITKTRKEESIFDCLITCPEMFSYLQYIKINDSYIHSRYIKKNNGIKVVNSDHIPIFGIFNIKWNQNIKQKSDRNTIYNFKDKNGIIKFKNLTS